MQVRVAREIVLLWWQFPMLLSVISVYTCANKTYREFQGYYIMILITLLTYSDYTGRGLFLPHSLVLHCSSPGFTFHFRFSPHRTLLLWFKALPGGQRGKYSSYTVLFFRTGLPDSVFHDRPPVLGKGPQPETGTEKSCCWQPWRDLLELVDMFRGLTSRLRAIVMSCSRKIYHCESRRFWKLLTLFW